MQSVLGSLSPQAFLDGFWQKKPLLIRQAIPNFQGFVDVADLCALARRDDAVSRIVTNHKGRLRLQEGPIAVAPRQLQGLPATILVQGIEGLLPGGWELLRRFDGIVPRARLDDLMISWASKGGGVGPHVDRYDVFLLQGPGRRRWQLAEGGDRDLDPDAEVPSLKHFVPEVEYVLEPGDMLYLPPGVAHHGIAVDGPCLTYSIGAVAPSVEGLLQNFLGFLSQRVETSVDLDAMYDDPDLTAPATPHLIDDTMSARVTDILAGVRFGADDIDEFLGRLLTGPKPHVAFDAPPQKVTPDDVAARLQKPGLLSLALPSRGLRRGQRVFLNGDVHVVSDADIAAVWDPLCRDRAITLPLLQTPSAGTIDALCQAIEAGFALLTPDEAPRAAPRSAPRATPRRR